MAENADLAQRLTLAVGTSLGTGLLFYVDRSTTIDELKGVIEQKHAEEFEDSALVLCDRIEVGSKHHPQMPPYIASDNVQLSSAAEIRDTPGRLECFAVLIYDAMADPGVVTAAVLAPAPARTAGQASGAASGQAGPLGPPANKKRKRNTHTVSDSLDEEDAEPTQVNADTATPTFTGGPELPGSSSPGSPSAGEEQEEAQPTQAVGAAQQDAGPLKGSEKTDDNGKGVAFYGVPPAATKTSASSSSSTTSSSLSSSSSDSSSDEEDAGPTQVNADTSSPAVTGGQPGSSSPGSPSGGEEQGEAQPTQPTQPTQAATEEDEDVEATDPAGKGKKKQKRACDESGNGLAGDGRPVKRSSSHTSSSTSSSLAPSSEKASSASGGDESVSALHAGDIGFDEPVFRGVRKPSDSSEESSEESDDECSDMPVTHSPIEPEAVTSTSSDSREEEASQRNRQVPRTTSSSGRDDEDISDTHVVTKLANKSISNKTLLGEDEDEESDEESSQSRESDEEEDGTQVEDQNEGSEEEEELEEPPLSSSSSCETDEESDDEEEEAEDWSKAAEDQEDKVEIETEQEASGQESDEEEAEVECGEEQGDEPSNCGGTAPSSNSPSASENHSNGGPSLDTGSPSSSHSHHSDVQGEQEFAEGGEEVAQERSVRHDTEAGVVPMENPKGKPSTSLEPLTEKANARVIYANPWAGTRSF